MPTEAEVWAVLDEIIHPSFGLSLRTLRMVDAVRVADGVVELDLVMDCPGCPAGEVARARVDRRLKQLEGVVSVRQKLLPRPWSPPWQGRE